MTWIAFLKPLSLAALGTLVGSMLLFTVVVTPTVFHALDTQAAGQFLRRLFPRYYLWCLVLSAIASLSTLAIAPVAAMILMGSTVLFIFARQWLMPQINSARDASASDDSDAHARFKRLHGFSVAIHLFQMLLNVGALIWLAA